MSRSGLVRTARTYFHTLKTLRAEQLVFRVIHEARERARRVGIAPELVVDRTRPSPVLVRDRLLALHRSPRTDARSRALETAREEAASALQGRFEYGGYSCAIQSPIDWHATGASRLARYHLHYLDALEPLAALALSGDVGAKSVGDALARDWLNANPIAKGEGWEPYPASTRFVNLVAWASVSPDAIDPARLIEHARWISGHLERHLLGNHLMRNLTSLAIASRLFSGVEAAAWGRIALDRLQREIADQVLADGGHHERSPMYQLIVLNDLLRVLALFRANADPAPSWLEAACKSMCTWASTMRHPDGEIPLFNDSAIGQAPPPSHVLELGAALGVWHGEASSSWRAAFWSRGVDGAIADAVQGNGTRVLAESGYTVVRSSRAALFMDFGPIGPSHLMGHAHSDTLGFELSLDGARFIADGGVAGYDGDPLRAHLRSAHAHSVAIVDGRGPDEMWKTFRVARRSHPGPFVHESMGDAVVQRGEVYSPFGWTHRRTIVMVPDEGMLMLDQVVIDRDDDPHRVEGQLQFHHYVTAEGDGRHFRAVRGQTDARVELRSAGSLRHGSRGSSEAWIAERFGAPVATTQLRFGFERHAGIYVATAMLDWSATFGRRLHTTRENVSIALGTLRLRYALSSSGWQRTIENI